MTTLNGVHTANVEAPSTMHPDVEEILFTVEQIREKIAELGRQAALDYKDKQPMIMPILKGGFMVAADVIRAMHPTPEGMVVEFVSASSYGAGFETTGRVTISFDTAAVKGRHVLLVDDLCDSGLTLYEVQKAVEEAGAASVKSLVLMDKTARRKVEYVPNYIGFPCPNRWLVGYGMDTVQIYRSLPYVGVLKKEAQAKYITK